MFMDWGSDDDDVDSIDGMTAEELLNHPPVVWWRNFLQRFLKVSYSRYMQLYVDKTLGSWTKRN